jgi:hypothetical protein
MELISIVFTMKVSKTSRQKLFGHGILQKSVTLFRAWRKLWPNVMFTEGHYEAQKFQGFSIWCKKIQLKELLNCKDMFPLITH